MTYREALEYLGSFVDYERTHQPAAMRAVTLERMRRLCRGLGQPQRRFRSVLVAGTNGKGSISAMLYSMLRASSLRAGLYTSPHLTCLRERIRVTDESALTLDAEQPGEDWISEVELAALVTEFRPALEAAQRESDGSLLTFFEVMTALAFAQFGRRQVELAVVEVGLGGRLDATNILEPDVAVFGPIDVDHTDVLGKDPAAIAKEKAGIIKPGQIVISAPQRLDVAEVIREACESNGVALMVCGADTSLTIQHHTGEGLQISVVGLRGIYQSLNVPLIGRHQAPNAAVAVMAMEALSDSGAPHTIVARGLSEVAWPGRLELFSGSPMVLLDGAHNLLAAQALCDTIRELWPERAVRLLFGMSCDKSVEAVGRILGPLSTSVVCTRSRHPRALDPQALAQRLTPFCAKPHAIPDPLDAYTYVLNTAGPSDLIVVTGSLFLVGELREVLQRTQHQPRRIAEAAS